jgi:hypothetical protein
MRKLLQQPGPDYYRFVQLLISRAELEQLRQWRVEVKRRSKIPLGMARAPDRSRQVHPWRTAFVRSHSPEVHISG